MRIERLQVSNHERWGKLVKTWATGTNYLEDDNSYPIPETVDEFKEQLAKAQVFATVPEFVTKPPLPKAPSASLLRDWLTPLRSNPAPALIFSGLLSGRMLPPAPLITLSIPS